MTLARPRIRSLRGRMRVLAMGAAILPLLGVLLAPIGDRVVEWQLRSRVAAAAHALDGGAPADATATRWLVAVQPAPPGSPDTDVVCAVRPDEPVEACTVVVAGWRVDGSARRRVAALWDDRYAVAEVCAVGALIGLVWASWWGRRLVADVEALAGEAADRAGRNGRIPPLPERGPTELVTVSRALNQLLAAREARAEGHARRAADLAHELKGVAATMRFAAEALTPTDETLTPTDETPPRTTDDPARAARLSRALTGGSQRLDAAISAFLALSRAEAGLPGEARVPVDLHALAHGLASTRPGVQVSGADRCVVVGVPDALESVLANLLDNAQSFAGPDGRVAVELSPEGLTVRDTGPGVPGELAERIFEPWFTTRPTGGGTGIGLALARAIVEAHGGTLTLTPPNRFEVRFGAG